jgi:hypothetical protein
MTYCKHAHSQPPIPDPVALVQGGLTDDAAATLIQSQARRLEAAKRVEALKAERAAAAAAAPPSVTLEEAKAVSCDVVTTTAKTPGQTVYSRTCAHACTSDQEYPPPTLTFGRSVAQGTLHVWFAAYDIHLYSSSHAIPVM